MGHGVWGLGLCLYFWFVVLGFEVLGLEVMHAEGIRVKCIGVLDFRLGVEDMGWKGKGLGFRVLGPRFGFGLRVQDIGLRVRDIGCRVQDIGCRVQDVGCRVQDIECRVQDTGFRVQGVGFGRRGGRPLALPTRAPVHRSHSHTLTPPPSQPRE